MKKNKYLVLVGILTLIIFFSLTMVTKQDSSVTSNKLNAIVINSNNKKITVQDNSDIIYTFSIEKNKYKAGDVLIIEYTGLLDKNVENQQNKLISITPVSQDEIDIIPRTKNSIFEQFNTLASERLKTMTLDEKIGQLLLVRYPKNNVEKAINIYKVGGFVFFEKDFENKTKDEVKTMINSLQQKASIPLLTAVDEEGGDVVRISSNSNLRAEKFLSPRDLYLEGGFDLIAESTKEKSKLLDELGLNVNLAPVVDVSTNSTDYIYDRTLGEGTKLTSTYAKTVIESSKENSVSYVLKHFPGYGNNEDTHKGKVIDTRSFEDIRENHLPPFEAGIKSNAEAILVNHNTVQSIDENNPASISASIHNLLRNNLAFTGIIMTDDLSMGAISSIKNATVKALLAGNDIIMTTDYEQSFNEINNAIENGTISEELVDNIVHRILSWKYYKGLMYEKTK